MEIVLLSLQEDMGDINSEALRVKSDIEKAFADVPYPGYENLVHIQRPEDIDVAEHFKDIRWLDWKDKPSLVLSKVSSGDLFLLSKEAYRYYLPLYMIQALVDYEKADLFPSEIIHSLAPVANKPAINKYVSRRISLMTPTQLKAILSYLEFFKREHGSKFDTWPIDEAITNIQLAINNS